MYNSHINRYARPESVNNYIMLSKQIFLLHRHIFWNKDFGDGKNFRYWHTLRVWKTVADRLKRKRVNDAELEIAALFHDIGNTLERKKRSQYIIGARLFNQRIAPFISGNLNKSRIAHIIRHHYWQEQDEEARPVYEADILDKLNFSSLIKLFIEGEKKGLSSEKITDSLLSNKVTRLRQAIASVRDSALRKKIKTQLKRFIAVLHEIKKESSIN